MLYISALVDKLLVYSTEIIDNYIAPTGMFSEEVQKARNKDLRQFWELHTRKSWIIAMNKDLVAILLLLTDPLINSSREKPKKKRKC